MRARSGWTVDVDVQSATQGPWTVTSASSRREEMSSFRVWKLGHDDPVWSCEGAAGSGTGVGTFSASKTDRATVTVLVKPMTSARRSEGTKSLGDGIHSPDVHGSTTRATTASEVTTSFAVSAGELLAAPRVAMRWEVSTVATTSAAADSRNVTAAQIGSAPTRARATSSGRL